MATVNERIKKPQAFVINGVDAGGGMTAAIETGYDNIIKSAPDGLQLPVKDKETAYCRGTIVTQDWVHFLDLLTGASGTYVFYERKDDGDEATGYVQHTIVNPVIHNVSVSFTKGAYATISLNFECKAADETAGIADFWTQLDAQAAPSYISAARGGYRIETCVHGADLDAIDIHHVTAFSFSLAMNLVKACNDADVGYTCVSAELENMQAAGSLSFQSAVIDTNILIQNLLAADAADLVLTLTQAQGAADKTITIANVDFNTAGGNSDASADFTSYTASFDIANDAAAPLTLEGENKIITIV